MRQYAVGEEPVPGYRLVRFLGRGNFSEVWQAKSPGSVQVALKILSLQDKQGPKEFRAVGLVKNIRHPNLSPLYAYWLKDEYGHVLADTNQDSINLRGRSTELIIAMGLGDKTLAQRLEECKHDFRNRHGLPQDDQDDSLLLERLRQLVGSDLAGLPLQELLDDMDQAAQAIDFLNQPVHKFGDGPPVAIQHRDIKPANLLVVGNGLQVCDYGLARALTTDVRTTQAAGTPAYMAPELFSGEPSRWTDQYSLALTYYELRTGRLPFDGGQLSLFQLMLLHSEGRLDFSLLPPAEQEVLRRATRPQPDQRYPNTLGLVRALRDATKPGRPGSATDMKPPVGATDPVIEGVGTPRGIDDRLRVGQELVPGYRLVRMLGRVGDGAVWEAKAPGGISRALKVIRDLGARQGPQEFRSLELIRDLDHVHLVRLYAYWLLAADGAVIPDEQIGQPAAPAPAALVAATDLASRNLLQLWQEGRERGEPGLPARDLVRYVREAAAGIDYLNGQGAVVHRDIKPENLLLTKNDRVKVNVGLAQLLEGPSAQLPTTNAAMAPHYAAPELFRGLVSRRTDQYSLALTYYKLRTGRWPYSGDPSSADIIRVHTEGRLDLSGVGAAEQAVLAKATAVDPDGRYATCVEMAEALGAALGLSRLSEPALPPPAPSAPDVWTKATESWPSIGELAPRKPPPAPPPPPVPPEPSVRTSERRWRTPVPSESSKPGRSGKPVGVKTIVGAAALPLLLGGVAVWFLYLRPPPDPAAELRQRVGQDVERLLGEQNFPEAAARVRAAEDQGAGAEWAAAQHERVRGAWRPFAEAKRLMDASLREFEAVLRDYPNDPSARARADELRAALALQQRVGGEVDKLVRQSNFPDAAARVRVAEGQRADAAWAAGQHERIRKAWREYATSKPTDEAQAAELDALLKEYRDDTDARAWAGRLSGRMGLRGRVAQEVERRLGAGDFRGAAVQVRAAEAEGAGAAWAAPLHQQIRAAWRQAAGARPTDEVKLAEFEALLHEYPDDPDTRPLADRLRASVAPRERVTKDVDKRLGANDYRGAAGLIRAAEAEGAGATWSAGQHERVRKAWRELAASKPTDDAQLAELEALLKEYPSAGDERARADELRARLALRKQGAEEVNRLLGAGDFRKAAARVRDAETGGAGAAWVSGQHERVRTAWRRSAAGKRTDAERLRELDALLKEYPGDADASAQVGRLRGNITLQEQVGKEVEKRLDGRDFRGAAAQVRVAVARGADAAWATGLHQRIRDAWRQAAEAKPADEARLSEYEDLSREYPDDAGAKVKAEDVRTKLAFRKKLGEELDRLLAGNDFRGAATRVRAADEQGVGAAWAAGQHERIRAAWRRFAAEKPADDDPLAEFQALLKEYPNDPDTLALADRVRKATLAGRVLDLGGGVTLRLVPVNVPRGGRTFRMGTPAEEPEHRNDERLQDMPLTRGYLLGETEVTVAQFRRFVQEAKYRTKALAQSPPLNWANPWPKEKQTDEHPVVCVTWSDADEFCRWLSARTGRKCRLPTEAEWEYACRSGGEAAFAVGKKLAPKDANFNGSFESELRAGFGPAPTGTVPVRRYPPNAWGLYDMHGNAAEWCADPYRTVPLPPGADRPGPDGGGDEFRVARGGSWQVPAEECRSGYRWKRKGSGASPAIGFRVCVEQ